MLEKLKMKNVYDYMFHLFSEYGKLMKYKPTIPPNATELCSELMACPVQENEHKFMMDSIVHRPSEVGPCELQPPFSDVELNTILRRKENLIKQVESWEEKSWATTTR
jgi:Glycosyl transferase family 90